MCFQLILCLFLSFFHRLFLTTPEALVHVERPCGRAYQGRIIGGRSSAPTAWPWIASVETINGINFCGGVLISPRHVLTAAHCLPIYTSVAPYVLRVSLGANVIGEGHPYHVLQIDLHPDYRARSLYQSDIAIVTLTRDVDFRRTNLRMVCLPQGDAAFDGDVVALGWGWTSVPAGATVDHLREVALRRLPAPHCEIYDHLWLKETMICAGVPEGGKDACKGDSGGPLLQKGPSGDWTVHGVVSYGKGCATKLYPGVYTNVFPYRKWIDHILYRSGP